MHITTENDLRNFFLRHKHLALYGTGGMGHNIYCYLRANHWEKQLDFYIVTLRTAKTFHGLPVHEVETLSDKEIKYPVLIATRNNFHAEIKKSLQDAGVKDIYTLSEPLLNMTERIAQSLPSENAPQQEAIVPPQSPSPVSNVSASAPAPVPPYIPQLDLLQQQMDELQSSFLRIQSLLQDAYCNNKALLLTEPQTYRYLDLLRYLRTGDHVLDLEAEYGAGADLLRKVSPVSSIRCLNSIAAYTTWGRAYYPSDTLTYQTGTYLDAAGKYQVILALNEKQNLDFGQRTFASLHDLLEAHGLLVLALRESAAENTVHLLSAAGFRLEETLYQQAGTPALSRKRPEESTVLFFARKRASLC